MTNSTTLATTITAGILTVVLIIAITVLLAAGVSVPEQFFQLLPVGFTAAVVGAAVAQKS